MIGRRPAPLRVSRAESSSVEAAPAVAPRATPHGPAHAPARAGGGGEPAQQELEVLVTPDEASRPLSEAEPAPFVAEAVHPAGHDVREGADRGEREPSLEERRGGLAHDGCPPVGSTHEDVEDPTGVALGVRIDPDVSGRLADEELIDVDPDPKLPRVVAGAARPLPRLVDRHGLVARPPPRRFGRPQPARRPYPPGARLPDRPPQLCP